MTDLGTQAILERIAIDMKRIADAFELLLSLENMRVVPVSSGVRAEAEFETEAANRPGYVHPLTKRSF